MWLAHWRVVYRDASVVFSPMADCVLYLVGSGEYDELMCERPTTWMVQRSRFVLDSRGSPESSCCHLCG